MYWTNWGEPATIEVASMDGASPIILHSDNLVWPNGLTIDYVEQRIYWADAFLDRIEYSNVDGSSRILLEAHENNVVHPFSITLEADLVFWTEQGNTSIFATHKTEGGDNFAIVYTGIFLPPFGIEAVTPDRQADRKFKTLN